LLNARVRMPVRPHEAAVGGFRRDLTRAPFDDRFIGSWPTWKL
jgi:hypothetical protein